jgi:type III secretion protein C
LEAVVFSSLKVTIRCLRFVGRLGCLGWVLQAALLPSAQVHAAQIQWRTDSFSYVAQDKPLKELIREFAGRQGVNVVIAPEVEGTVNGKFNLAPQSMLDLLATSFGLTWYYDGSVLYVYPTGDMSTEVVQLGATTADQLQVALSRLGVADRRFPIAYDRAHNTARVAGPRRYVELVKQTVDALDQQAGGAEGSAAVGVRTGIRVFPLHYAWAADFTYTADGQDRTLPGVASVLQQLYAPNQVVVNTQASRSNKLERMRGFGYFRDNQLPDTADGAPLVPVAPRQPAANYPATSTSVPVAARGDEKLPQFQADGRMNAVIVRDVPEHMPFYDAVIHSLDVKPGLVEIEARIIEVDVDSVDSLGIDWRGHSGSADLQISQGIPSALQGSTTSALPVSPYKGFVAPAVIPASQLPLGGVLSTVIGDSGRYLKARISALAEDGKANVLSSPRVLTLDNVEAVLENLSTFFVPVAGNLDVGLYNVSAGTSLRVTPLIVVEEGHTQIKLAVRIDDGGLTQQTVGTLPVVQRTSITTQAFINEGESLLIGGYRSDGRNDTNVGVPGLSKIPVLGNLFKHRQKETTHVEHLFMLTPHVLQPAFAH